VRDGIALARLGLPAVALVTSAFSEQRHFVARAVGMQGIPMLELPHPTAGIGPQAMARVAADLAPRIVAALAGQA